MRDDEIIKRIQADRRWPSEPARIGRHDVFVETIQLLTTVYRVRDGAITLVRAAQGTFREDLAAVLLDVADRTPGDLGGVVHATEIQIDGLALDRVAVFQPSRAFNDPELAALTVAAVPVHRSEVRDGETTAGFEETTGKLMRLPINEWNRRPKPRAHARLLDDWPGGRMRKVKRPGMWPAEYLLAEVAPDLGSGLRLEVTDVRGHRMVLSRTWDRLTGTYVAAGTAQEHPVDVPRLGAWPALQPVFAGASVIPASLIVAGEPETDVLDVTYEANRGGIDVPALQTLTDCRHVLDVVGGAPDNWAVFASRSDAVVQVRCCDDGQLWLETPNPEIGASLGRHVTVDEAAGLLTVLAREDRSAVAELGGLTTVAWDS